MEKAGKATYYHATTRARLPSILANGLDPKFCSDTWKEDWEPAPFIFLAWTRKSAENFLPEDGSGVVLVVTPPRSFTRRFRYRLGEFIRVPMLIPPEYLKVLD